MAKTPNFTATSVDGYIADAGHSLDRLFEVDRDEEGADVAFAAFFADVGAMAMRRTTCEWVVDHGVLRLCAKLAAGCSLPAAGVSLEERGGLRYGHAGSSLAVTSSERAICSAALEYSAP